MASSGRAGGKPRQIFHHNGLITSRRRSVDAVGEGRKQAARRPLHAGRARRIAAATPPAAGQGADMEIPLHET